MCTYVTHSAHKKVALQTAEEDAHTELLESRCKSEKRLIPVLHHERQICRNTKLYYLTVVLMIMTNAALTLSSKYRILICLSKLPCCLIHETPVDSYLLANVTT